VLRHAFYWLQRLANPPAVVIRIEGGSARLAKGLPPPGFVGDCSAIAEDFGIDRGYVECVAGHRGITLRFSPNICAASHQRFRNVLGAHRSRS
jgi:hypothetical protein